jgi:putative transposase
MNDAPRTRTPLPLPTEKDVLTAVLHHGATHMLAQTIQAEVDAYLQARSHLRDDAGRQQIVRNGSLPERTILTGIGPVEIKQLRVQDRRPPEQRRELCRR